MTRRGIFWICTVVLFLALIAPVCRWSAPQAAAAPAGALLSDGDFEKDMTGKQLRTKETPQGWYESRGDGHGGRMGLTLSKKPVAGDATKKAMVKANAKFNTYLSQEFSQPQTGRFSLKWDILVKEIASPANRSAFQMIGDDSMKGKGPNATATERFVFLGFENAAVKGKINLFAFEGGADPLAKRTAIASNLDLGKWYTVKVDVDPAAQTYAVSVQGAAPVTVHAFQSKAVPKKLTAVSFASWNDGPGTFYIDNVAGQP
jgi:hypothetical protein